MRAVQYIINSIKQKVKKLKEEMQQNNVHSLLKVPFLIYVKTYIVQCIHNYIAI